jgi:hypothetical protein
MSVRNVYGNNETKTITLCMLQITRACTLTLITPTEEDRHHLDLRGHISLPQINGFVFWLNWSVAYALMNRSVYSMFGLLAAGKDASLNLSRR